MQQFSSVNDPKIIQILNDGGIGVLRTDTLYGIVARADDESAVERIFALKGRDADKSPIVLVDSVERLYDTPSAVTLKYLYEAWPGPVSVIMPSVDSPEWIRRSNHSVAYRLPGRADLCDLLTQTGPLIAPSANPQGEAPALSIDEAIRYFGEAVDFYVDGGNITNAEPSQLIRVHEDGSRERLR